MLKILISLLITASSADKLADWQKYFEKTVSAEDPTEIVVKPKIPVKTTFGKKVLKNGSIRRTVTRVSGQTKTTYVMLTGKDGKTTTSIETGSVQ